MSAHHHHHGAHEHGPTNHSRAFALGVALNTGFVVVEATFGLISGSMALVADAGHNLSDVLGLLIAWGAAALAARPARDRFTYGFKSSSIFAALANACLLLVAVGAIAVESLRRLLLAPAPVGGTTVMVVAAIGIVINTFTALLFLRGRKHDLNIRGAFLHMAADAAVSAGVLVAGFAVHRTGAAWIDPATGLVIVAVIAIGTWGLLREAVAMALLAVPAGIDEAEVRRWLAALPGVAAIHDLHIWPMSTTETAFTAHLVMPAGHPGDDFLRRVSDGLNQRFAIGHATIQVETAKDALCRLDCEPA